jgi:hypothetical protein
MAAAQAAAQAMAAAAARDTQEPQHPGAPGPFVPDDPGLNPVAPAELLPLELPRGAPFNERARPVGARGTGAALEGCDRETFAQRFGELSFKTLLTQPEVVAALVKIRAECAKVGGCFGPTSAVVPWPHC